MTYASAAGRGTNYESTKELALEGAISVVTLIPGLALYRIPAIAGKTLAMSTRAVMGIEYGSNVAVGFVADNMRSLFHGTDISWSSSLGQNLLYALAPLVGGAVLRNIPQRVDLANRTKEAVVNLDHLKKNGGTPAQVQAAANKVAGVADEAATLQAANAEGSMIGSKIPKTAD